MVSSLFCLFCWAGDETQDLVHLKQPSTAELHQGAFISLNHSCPHEEIGQGTFEMASVQPMTKIRQEALHPETKEAWGNDLCLSGLVEGFPGLGVCLCEAKVGTESGCRTAGSGPV